MALLEAYFDDSGTHESARVAVVGGYVGQISAWRKFKKKWKIALKTHRVPTEKMRRSDLENYKGAFLGWTKTQREELLKELHPLIREYTRVAVGHAVIKDDWEEVMPNDLKRFFGGAYGWCAHSCIVGVRAWCVLPEHRHEHPMN
jgi:hypothetical protein